MRISFSFDGNIRATSALRREKITAQDWPVLRALDPKMLAARLARHGEWIASPDRNIVFHAVGDGAFDAPETYHLYYGGKRIQIECGGGGLPAMWHSLAGESAAKLIVLVTGLHLPAELADQDQAKVMLALAAEAFAVGHMNPHPSTLTVEFRMYAWQGDAVPDDRRDVADEAA